MQKFAVTAAAFQALPSFMTKPAAQYLRMSTDHQRYSLLNQAATIAAYAGSHGFHIVRTYEDAGKSGLSIRGRDGLKQLLADVLTGSVDYRDILVRDVSRWGRYQDPDQAAHYEFVCREAGVRIHYCAEAFENDGSLTSTIVKHLKRVMAGEYSRELSGRIKTAQRRAFLAGNVHGGPPPTPCDDRPSRPTAARERCWLPGKESP